MKKVLPFLLLAAALSAAQIYLADSTAYVTGKSSILVLPDAATVEFRIEIRESDMSKVIAKANDLTAEITKELRKAGVDQPLIQSGPADIYTELNWESQRLEHVYGLRLDCAVDDLSKVDDILVVLAATSSESEGSRISSYTVNYFVKDPSVYLPELQKMALADAKTKAEQASAAHGLKAGEILDSNYSEPYSGYLSVWDPYLSWDFSAKDMGGKNPLPRVALVYEISATFKLID
ncbi:hypothetical protein ES703_73077 [subsurface metagenome]|nr:DUF541 domain-containing protein [bacterium]